MRRILAGLLLVATTSLHADDLDTLETLSQAQFGLLASDLAAAFSYTTLQAPEPYGVIGFDIAAEASAVRLANPASWQAAGADVSTLVVTRVSATKGLPLGFDIGGFVSTTPGAKMRGYGAQLRYALLEGGVATPAIGLRAAVTRLDGVEQLDYRTHSLDLALSKGIGPLTPYAGFGRVWASAMPVAETMLLDEDISQNRAFAGVRLAFVVLELTLEAQRTGETTGYAAKFGVAF